MAKLTKAQKKKLAEAQKLRQTVFELLRTKHPDWDEWEWGWLHNEAHREPNYIYTEKEQAVLDRLIIYSRSFTEYARHTVPELIAIAYRHRCDLNEDNQLFVEQLHAWGAVDLKRRQIQRLAVICRRTERIGRDPLKGYVPPQQDEAA
jgi:hypothetical protein